MPTTAKWILMMYMQVDLQPLITSLADPLLERLWHNVDVLLFNPPYVPTVSEEWETAQAGRSLEGSWAGGADGMQLTNKLLMKVDVSVLHSFCLVPFANHFACKAPSVP